MLVQSSRNNIIMCSLSDNVLLVNSRISTVKGKSPLTVTESEFETYIQ